MPRRRNDVASFGPHLMEFLLRAGKEEVRVPFPERRLLDRYYIRVNMLRKAMRLEDHPNYQAVANIKISKDKETNTLVAVPWELEGEEYFEAAGIHVDHTPVDFSEIEVEDDEVIDLDSTEEEG